MARHPQGSSSKRSLILGIWIAFAVIVAASLVVFLLPSSGQISSFVFRTNGEVTVYSPAVGAWENAFKGQTLEANFRIKTAASAWAEVRLDDGSLLRIGENTELKIVSLYINPMMGIRTARWRLEGYGSIYVNTGETGSIYEIVTPSFLVSAISGTMRVNGDGQGNFQVKVPDEKSLATLSIASVTTRVPPKSVARIKGAGELEMSTTQTDEHDAWNSQMDAPDLEVLYDSATAEPRARVNGTTNPGNVLLLNGTEVAKADEKGVFEFWFDLPLGTTKHKVTARDPAGRFVEKDIQIERLEAGEHLLVVMSPQDGAETDEETIDIIGTVKGSVSLELGGKPVQVSNGAFNIKAPLEIGINHFNLLSEDKSGKTIEKSIAVTRLRDVPMARIVVVSPQDGSITFQEQITIRGESDAEYVFMGQKVTIVDGGKFEFNVQLDFGKNALVLTARDDTHRAKSITFVVFRSKPDSTPPVITISSYQGLTNKDTADIYGEVSNAKSLQIGSQAVIFGEDGTFVATVKLSEGENRITFHAMSPDGGTASKTVTIVKDTIPPDLSKLKAKRVIGEIKVVVQGLFERGSRLVIDGEPVPEKDIVRGEKYDTLVYVIETGLGNKITVVATDEAGNEARTELRIEETTEP